MDFFIEQLLKMEHHYNKMEQLGTPHYDPYMIELRATMESTLRIINRKDNNIEEEE